MSLTSNKPILPQELFSDTLLANPYIPHDPTIKQAEFLVRLEKECLYGGAAGGGKSDALLMAALMFVEVPGYAAIIFRESFSDLALPGAIMDRATEWLGPYLNDKMIHWDDKIKTFQFPSGSTLSFGYLTGPRDRFRYQSAEFQFIGFDELTQLKERDYRYLMSRLRRLVNTHIPLRIRAASNPGGTGHDWVKDRFVVGGKLFIPAKLDDNPHLDREEYIKTLMELDPVTRAQLMNGDWEIGIEGNLFKRYWFKLNDIADNFWNKKLRFWDLAATEKNDSNEPDWCTGLLLGRHDNRGCVLDIVHVRLRPAEVEATIAHTARLDGKNVRIAIEQEGGASAKLLIDTWKRGILKGYTVDPARPSGNKVVRAKVVSAPSERGEIDVKHAGWNNEFFDELTRFPEGAHDDITDSFSGAYAELFGDLTGVKKENIPKRNKKNPRGGFT
jgi:predicted phage terminase large subunit-like protein